MSTDYWGRIRATLADFCCPGDELRCVRLYWRPNATCELCGHSPISFNFVLRNVRTGRRLTVGRHCVYNYKRETGRPVVFPAWCSRAADSLNAKLPGCATVTEPERRPLAQPRPHYPVPPPEPYEPADDRDDERELCEELGLDPDDPDFFDLAAEGMHPDEVDWESCDFDVD